MGHILPSSYNQIGFRLPGTSFVPLLSPLFSKSVLLGPLRLFTISLDLPEHGVTKAFPMLTL